MFLDDDLPKHKQPEPFPRKLEGKSVTQLDEYKQELLAEIQKIDDAIAARGDARSAAEKLFK